MMKHLVSATVLCLGAVSFSSQAAQWYVAGPAIGETSIELEQNDEGLFVLELAELPNTGFYFHDEGENKFLGGDSFNGERIVLGTPYMLSSMGYDIRLADNVTKVKDALIQLNPDGVALMLTGTAEEEAGTGTGPGTGAGEKGLSITPEPGTSANRFGEFILTFEGYDTVSILDPAMYDPMFGPVTFTELSTGIVRSQGGAQPLPFLSNSIPVQLGRTIFNRELIEEYGTEDEDDLPFYEEHDMIRDNGKYVLDIPAGCFELRSGDEVAVNEALSFVYTLGTSVTGISTLAPQYQGRDIYTLNGVLVVRNASAEDINALPAGIYVMGGRKIARK